MTMEVSAKEVIGYVSGKMDISEDAPMVSRSFMGSSK
jgi:hypothetical protein